MIGIYNDDFIDFLRNSIGEPIKVTSKQIICRCPWCEYNVEKNHYHLYISLQAPIFNCFHCPDSLGHKGIINKLISKLNGTDISDKYINKDKIQEYISSKVDLKKDITKTPDLNIPIINEDLFPKKSSYLRSRLKYFNMELTSIKGLIFDVQDFINKNNIPVDEKLYKLQPFLHDNFIGFLTENKSTLILRNIDPTSNFRYYKIKIYDTLFLDYYKINGQNQNSKNIIIGEGIFDIFSEYLFDYLGIKRDVLLYASANSKKFDTLIRSIIFREVIPRPNVYILSDKGIDLNDYKKLAYFNKYCINSLIVFYNKLGKDFNDVPCEIEKIQLK